MASESREDLLESVTLPAELREWLNREAAAAGVERDALVVGLLAAYRTAALEEDGTLFDDEGVLERADDHLQRRLKALLDDRIDDRIGDHLDDHLDDRTDGATGATRELVDRVESLESAFDEKLEDVRGRVIQVKKEADAKASAEHSHGEFEEFDRLQERVDALESALSRLETESEETTRAHDDRVDEHDERLEELDERLRTVGWAVRDLREAQHSDSGVEVVERIKRAAARADVERARCENCGEGVALSLLTAPQCPHCEAAVTNVEPASGWFGTSTLTAASRLEPGEDDG